MPTLNRYLSSTLVLLMAVAAHAQDLLVKKSITAAGSAAVAAPLQLEPKAPGKIRIGVAPPDAQLGQGNNASADYSTAIRNVEVALMNGPAVEIAALEAHIPLQLQAEAQQKQCDYILYSGVIVKHSSGGGLGRFMKIGSTAASFTPMGMMAHGVGSVLAAQAAGTAASQVAQQAQQQAISQLDGSSGQIKLKDDSRVQSQLVAAAQSAQLLQNTLQGNANSAGEDIVTPLLQQTANAKKTAEVRKGFGRFMKIGSAAASFTPLGMVARGVGSVVTAQAAGAAASQMAQQRQPQAMSQLAGFNGQIKSKDDVTVQYQLVVAAQNASVLQNTLQGEAKSDGEDVLTPLLQQTANAVLTQVVQK
jgi:hypothetical protein